MRKPHLAAVSGWGRCPTSAGQIVASEDFAAITSDVALSRGLGRSYGDASLPAARNDIVAESTLADRLLSFDSETGVLRAEAGLSLVALNQLSLPRGWFTPVTPGTQFVTLGGMVAADVHGKNHHHAGSFGAHVRSILLRVADGRLIECSEEHEPALFRATLGGMGLTGHILEVAFAMERVPSPWIWSESERIGGLDAMIKGLRSAASDWPFTMGWIDCLARGTALGRGILMRGRWAQPNEAGTGTPRFGRAFRMPIELPTWVLSRWAIQLFNVVYYRTGGGRHLRKIRRGRIHPQPFFYPLDAILDWNLMYGRRGFTQFQCVLPHADDNGPARRYLDFVARRGNASFLSVIKDFGPEGAGLLSFPRPGITITLDFAVRPGIDAFVAELNQIVLREGGRVYLAKDAFTTAEDFRKMEPRLEAWEAVRRRWDPAGKLRSAQSVRLFGDRL